MTDEEYIKHPAYLLDSLQNGQHKQCQELIQEHGHTAKTVIEFMETDGYSPKIMLSKIKKLFN
jgi:hypothetical protein